MHSTFLPELITSIMLGGNESKAERLEIVCPELPLTLHTLKADEKLINNGTQEVLNVREQIYHSTGTDCLERLLWRFLF